MQVHPGRLGLQTLCVLAWLSSCIGLALSAAQDQPPRPDFRTEASYVRVDVYPTHDGAPIADLRQEDFEVLEDKVPQKLDRFEHIVVRSGGLQETRREPNTIAEARQALDDSRARVLGALFFRRAQSTGDKDVPTADLRFRRMDQLRLDVPTPSTDAVSARLLDRTGKAMSIPIAASVRDDGDGSRWRTVRLPLAPFAPGDYVIELASRTERTLLAFRVVQ